MTYKQSANLHKPFDTTARYRLQAQAEAMAHTELSIKGYLDPRLNGISDYEAMRAYDDILASTISGCLRRLCEKKAKEQSDIAPRSHWADKTYS